MKINTLIKLIITTLIVFSNHVLSAKPGDLDSSFGENGIVRTKVESLFTNHISSIVLDNGNIIVASGFEYYMQSRGVQLICYSPNGSLNDEFGILGKVETVCGAWNDYEFRNYDPYTIKLQDNKNFIVAGLYVDGHPLPMTTSILLIRYNLDGSIDPSFGINGKTVFKFTDRCNEILNIELQSDGKIIALAAIDTSTGPQYMIFQYKLMRFTKDGSLDSTFGLDGIVDIEKIQINKRKQPMVILENNSIILCGSVMVDEYYDFALCKYDENGTPDINFGEEGLSRINFSKLKRLGISEIQIVGGDKLFISDRYHSLPKVFIGFAIIDTEGDIHNDLGGNDKLFTQLPDYYIFQDIILHKQNILCCGWIGDTAFVTRLELDGNTDPTFGNNGYTYIPLSQAINAHIYNNNLIITGAFIKQYYELMLSKILIDDENNVKIISNEYNNLLVAPNPIRESALLTIFDKLHGLLSIRLYDINGEMVQETQKYCVFDSFPLRFEFQRDNSVRSGRYLMVISDQSHLISTFIEID